KQATHIHWTSGPNDAPGEGVDLTEDDLLFMTIGSLTENSDEGDQHTPAKLDEGPAPAWDLWRKIAAKDPAFGRPGVFADHTLRPSGSRPPSPLWTNGSRSTSRRSPSGTRTAARSSPAASSPPRNPAG